MTTSDPTVADFEPIESPPHMFWVTPSGHYRNSLYVPVGSLKVTERPTLDHQWIDGQWVDFPTVPRLVAAVQSAMDAKAQEKGYDDIKSAALRAGYPGPFRAEGIAYASWMDTCWATAYGMLAEVQAGARALPTVAEAVAAMPALVLPA